MWVAALSQESHQISCILDIYTTNLNSSKITVIMEKPSNFMVGVTTTLGSILKGSSIRKVENHCYTQIFTATLFYLPKGRNNPDVINRNE